MNIGILYEGKNDEKALEEFVNQIVKKNYDILGELNIEFYYKRANGNIEGFIQQAVHLFFELNSCFAAVFVSDLDVGATQARNKKQRISRKIKNSISSIHPGGKYIKGFPSPSLEEWLIFDEGAVIKALDLNTNQLPYSGLKPKERLLKIIHKNNSSYLTDSEVYQLIVQNIDIEKLLENPRFRYFYNALLDLLKEFKDV